MLISMTMYLRVLRVLVVLLIQGVSVVDGQGVNLGGSILTRTDVKSFADISQDIGEIRNLLAQEQTEGALQVYRKGTHSEISTGVKRSLSGIANELSAADPKSPSYLFHLYGLANRNLNLAFAVQELANINTVVEETITKQPTLAAEAIWVMNVWMYGTHLLFNGAYECSQRSKASNPNVFDIGTAGWDEFIALWIGSGQQPGSNKGDSLYAWAQSLGERFGTNNPESPVNTRIKLFYQEALALLSVNNACTRDNTDTAEGLWQLTLNTVSEMSKPLFQGFLAAIADKEDELVDLYAKALVPQLAKCRPSLYKKMHEHFILGSYDSNTDDVTIVDDLLEEEFPWLTFCFGYGCYELAKNPLDPLLPRSCDTFEVFTPTLAGYKPTTEIGNVAAADLDIYQMNILINLNILQYAELMYLHGGNIAIYRDEDSNDPLEYVSLHNIAIVSERSAAQPYFDQYVTYNNEKNYADNVIRQALSGSSKWSATQQISAIVTTTAAYQILLLEAISRLAIGVGRCVDGEDNLLNPVDEAAALIIGSMEGARLGGSRDLEDGQLVYRLANKHAFEFNTITKQQYAKSVSTMEDLFFAARAELDSKNCDALDATIDTIFAYAMVGIAQGCIKGVVDSASLGDFSTAASLAQVEGLSLALLPLISDVNKPLADSIAANTIRTTGQTPVPDGAVSVAQSIGLGFTTAVLLDCHRNLGRLDGVVDPCQNVQCNGYCIDVSFGTADETTFTESGTARWVVIFVGVIGLLAGGYMCYRFRNSQRDMKQRIVQRRTETKRLNEDTLETRAEQQQEDEEGEEEISYADEYNPRSPPGYK